ncbi:filamentation protein [Paecilomyces variotii No. 5]|uniref:Filamentation protein n=1 Tax=Byssochlamys spectabilis (strain No. 5 / NBRC 109023) TaxID=1356009 RepID=V5HRI3_BYSSN|nr:filamentation protein [Paecilomyces variotii No. 5]
MSGNDKAHRYIAALDDARCQDRWSLLQVASAENQIVTYIHSRPSTAATSNSASASTQLSELIPTLLSVIEEAQGTPQDIFQAQVCLGWVHWVLSEPALAAARLPKDFYATVQTLSEEGEALSPWTEVCLVKGCYLKGAGQSLVSTPDEAMQTFSSVLPWLAALNQAATFSPQLLFWTEKLLAKAGLIASTEAQAQEPGASDKTIELALKSFRLWSAHPNVKSGLVTQNAFPVESPPQSAVWRSYYDLLSAILQRGLDYVPSSEGSARLQLASEYRRVESVSETSLLKEVRFPPASSTAPEVEAWVEQVIGNWEVLCGPDWTDEDLGEGGQNALSRNVLDILYRAATKTYHSHLILRRLFHVHSALADFYIAMKALDSYVEIVMSAKERAEKGAELGELEDEEVLLRTISEGVLMLCSLGAFSEAEKAKKLTDILVDCVEKDLQGGSAGHKHTISPPVIAMTYRAIGIGLANWARWTPVNESRDDIRAEALDNLERSIAPEWEDQFNISSYFALSLLLAETRDLDGAIDCVKSALAWNSQTISDHAITDSKRLSKERDLVPLWHLLALLLSAKQDFDIAGRSCEAAFEQFPAAVNAFGQNGQSTDRDSAGFAKALINKLSGREKERIIETRMTQLALVEVMDGPEVALNHSDQLLSLFAALFGEHDLVEKTTPTTPTRQNGTKTEQLEIPRTSAGSVRSFRGSIFGRKKHNRQHDSDAPAIPAIDEEQNPPTRSSRSGSLRHKLHRAEDNKSSHHEAQRRNSKETNGIASTEPKHGPEEPQSPETVGIAVSDHTTSPSSNNEKQPPKQPLPPPAHNMNPQKLPPPAGHKTQPPQQDVRLPTSDRFDSPTGAVIRFPTVQAQKHALVILVKIWLLIAGLYRRSGLFEDAGEACEEASKQASRFEALVASQESSAKTFSERSWGTVKSSEELWGDVEAERGAISLAQGLPHEAISHLESALMRFPDHPKATILLANLLLDIWDEKIPAEPRSPGLRPDFADLSLSDYVKLPGVSEKNGTTGPSSGANGQSKQTPQREVQPAEKDSPQSLGRLAARDRAYMLVSTLTKLGTSWDNSEAWFTLARVYEAGDQLEKAKEVLWWVVELEDRRPVRHWWDLGSGGYVL